MDQIFHKAAGKFEKFSCYIVAHADDWQLFMQPPAHSDLVEPGCKTVIIIVTAGEAGMGEQFWRAREEGSKSSVRFCLAPHGAIDEAPGSKQIDGHMIGVWSANNTITYFLRLPDGNLDGNGFEASGFQSLTKFTSSAIDQLTAIDHSATYRGWLSFVRTIESIIQIESAGISNRWIHYLNPDKLINPNDHPDHIATGAAIQDMSIINSLHQLLFVGYNQGHDSQQQQQQQLLPDLFWKASLFGAYEKAVYDLSGYSTLKENPGLYISWCCSKPTVQAILPVFE